MFLFRKKSEIISNHVIKADSDKLKKRAIREMRKLVKKGEIYDTDSLSLHLHLIDERYTHLKDVVRQAVLVVDYDTIRAEKMAETGRLNAYFDREQAELNNLLKVADEKAAAAGIRGGVKREPHEPIDVSKLRERYNRLLKESN